MNLRDQQAAATRQRLLESGIELFGLRGYSAVSAVEIVQHANVTRGALYHHFASGKRSLFEAVSEYMLQELVNALANASPTGALTWKKVPTVFEAFFDAASTQFYKQIVLEDAPSVLGSQPWRELEYKYSVSFIEVSLDSMMAAGLLRKVPVKPIAILIFGACCEAALEIAYSNKPNKAKARAIDGLMSLLDGLKK